MGEQRPSYSDFRRRLADRENLFGTFVKLPTTQAIEILGAVGFDFIIIDQEHASLDRGTTDLMILGARASNVAPIVRVPEATDAQVLSALDAGASGVMVPHVYSVEKARAVARSCRYAGGSRGFGGLTRASRWGALNGPDHMRRQDAEVTCIAMIEDVDAVERVADIAGVDGIDAIFIGRGDLTASFGDDKQAKQKVAALTARIAEGVRAAGKPLLMLATDVADAAAMRKLGATAMLVASDHAFLKGAASAALRDHAPPV